MTSSPIPLAVAEMPNLEFYRAMLLPPPLPALLAVFLVLGLWQISVLARHLYQRRAPSACPGAVWFIASTALLAALLHLVISLVGVRLLYLRGLAWTMVGFGLIGLIVRARRLSAASRNIWRWLVEGTAGDQILFGLSAALAAGWLVLALAPATDADSLDYHLGVGLEWLRTGHVYPRTDWFSYRLFGPGETLNMLGLAGGTDCFGSALQFSGLVTLLTAFVPEIPSRQGKLLFALSVLSCPLLLFLVPSQKPQLLPSAALAFGLLLVWRNKEALNVLSMCLTACLICFALASRYACFPAGTLVAGVLLFYLWRDRRFSSVPFLAVAGLLILFPLCLQKFLFYGDPLSPLLEAWKSRPDPMLLDYARLLHSLESAGLFFPLNLLIPDNLGRISAVLGTGLLALLLLPRRAGSQGTFLLWAALAATLGLRCLGLRSGRFYLEPYVWLLLAVLGAEFTSGKGIALRLRLFRAALIVQALAVLGCVGYGVVELGPGCLSPTGRERVLRYAALDYQLMEWADQVLPQDARMLTTFRSVVFYPRQFVHRDLFFPGPHLGSAATRPSLTTLKNLGVTVIVTEFPLAPDLEELLRGQSYVLAAPPRRFTFTTRNPFNRGDNLQAAILVLR